jgi:[acyl-carrier-protein] S-malonyltransferase
MSAPCFLFPGQGSQVIGMAKSFYDAYREVKSLFDEASEISELDLKTLCFEGPMDALTRTRNLQPAMTTAVLACYLGLRYYDLIPSYVAGHSLGEYPALVAAEVISITDCLKLVTLRGKLMDEQAEKNPGAMTAIMRVSQAKAEEIIAGISKTEPLRIANYNSPKQFVASGSVAGIEKLEATLKSEGGRGVRLNVSGAWHSPLMDDAAKPLADAIEAIEFSDAKMPIALNVTGTLETEAEIIKNAMKKQMISSVLWFQGIHEIWKKHIRVYIEPGPKGVLTRMMKTISPDPPAMTCGIIDNKIALEAFMQEDEDY